MVQTTSRRCEFKSMQTVAFDAFTSPIDSTRKTSYPPSSSYTCPCKTKNEHTFNKSR